MRETTNDTRRALPAGWRWVRLGEVAQLNPKRPAFSHGDSSPITFVPMPAVDDVTGTIARPETRPYAEVKRGYTYFADGDVLFAKITPCMQNGKHAIARGLIGGIGFGSTEFHVIRPGSEITPEWIHLFVRQPEVLQAATAHFTGAVGQKRVPVSFLANLQLPFPPLPEQKRITAMLNQQMAAVERARTAAQGQLDEAKALPAAYLRQVFPAPGQELPAGWRWVRLGEVCELNPRRPSLTRADDAPTTFVPMPAVDGRHGAIAASEIRPYGEVKRGYTYFAEGDVLFAKITPCMQNGKHAIARGLLGGLGFASTEFHVIRPREEVRPEWIHFFVRQPRLLQDATTQFTGAVGQQRVPESYLASLALPLPPVAQQGRIVAVLSEQVAAVERLRAHLETRVDEVGALPVALLRRAFRGEL